MERFSLEQSSIEGFFEDSTVYEYTPDFEFDKKKSSPSESLSIVFTLSPIKINFIQTPSKTNISSGVNKKSLPSLI
jgi:hypothetical protein